MNLAGYAPDGAGGAFMTLPATFISVDETVTAVGAGVVTAASAAAARTAINADIYVNAKDFNVVGDGTTDDTVALQAWLTYICTNSKQGYLPNGTYKITDTLIAPAGYGWGIRGENENYAVLRQHTNNIPVLQVGDTSASSHTVRLDGFTLTYSSAQPSTSTNANCLVFQGPTVSDLSTVYWSSFRHLQFRNGYYAMTVASGKYPPWGCEFDMLTMYGMSGGFYDNTVSATSGCPNNKWGRMTLFCNGAVGPIIKNWRGYNLTVGAIEFLTADQGPQLITTASGFTADIGSLKLEIGTYTGVGAGMIQLSNPCHVRIGSITIGGTTAVYTPSSGIQYIIQNSGAGSVGDSDIEIGSIAASATSLSGTCVAVGGGSAAKYTIRNVDLANGWTLQSTGSTLTGNNVTVSDWVNGSLSGDKGDADYTVTLGDANVVQFNTAFTAQRTITLPSATSNDLCAGLYYDLIFDGAINGLNTALIKRGSTTLRTQTVDKKRLRYQWRRGASTGEWVLVDIADISDESYISAGSQVDLFTSSGTWTKPDGAVSVRVRCVGPGGGGGAGARGPSGTALSGGGGGSSGGMSEMVFDADDLSATVAVTVGTGGTGATGQTSDGTAGANGGTGSATSFGSYLSGGRGQGGTGGGLASAGTGGAISTSGYGYGMQTGLAGGAGSAAGAAGAAGASGGSAGGGGGGGGITTAPAATAGGGGGITFTSGLSGGTAGSGANGGNGNTSVVRGPGTGGGGGGGNAAGSGYTGGAGGSYGAGGGGGGASLNGSTSGAGGNGGDGVCIVVTYF